MDASTSQIENVKELLQCYYFNTERILHNIQLNDIDAYLTGQCEPSFISVYIEPKYHLVDISGIDIVSSPNPIGCITSRSLNMYYRTPENKTNYALKPIYYIDFICVHREKNKDNDKIKINRQLLQTHEYNQRIQNTNVTSSIIKKEIDLFDGIIPMVKYDTYTFHLRNIHFPKLPAHFELIQINTENSDILFDFLHLKQSANTGFSLDPESLESVNDSSMFDIMVLPDIGNITALIKQRLLYVYCLRKKKDIYGIYFIKDAKMQFDDIEGNTLQCIGSVNQMVNSNSLFYVGFLHGLRQIIHKHPEFKMILIEDIGHNTILLNHWRTKHTPIFVNKTAYYTYNFIYPSSPIAKEKCFILQ